MIMSARSGATVHRVEQAAGESAALLDLLSLLREYATESAGREALRLRLIREHAHHDRREDREQLSRVLCAEAGGLAETLIRRVRITAEDVAEDRAADARSESAAGTCVATAEDTADQA